MRWPPERARKAFTESSVARLSTVSEEGWPHCVPVTFAVDGDTVAIAIDHKPKSTVNVKRLANIGQNPKVCLLADVYSDDWSQLWWARADGTAQVVGRGEQREHALDTLQAKYPQYADRRPEGPVILVHVVRWSGWSFR
ncbi:TIGR03668 family PPOX class F420-dependent oxidoreductase [Nocardiopsis sp. RSe5-2]|uniref:TIGR03668 family PPOX class F420-dependent oxidoreductase n=1 Tax=Nocardiopsis endophytica TaxID=3018445 RepID=A0ABT4U4X9_9ACTN|nr:TIGR03668 family PPOX class F420-dependent oxidoreductase [Nocardiopsis endophytica]MDA2812008.1 TIGR03668 family PPOX class F420-dependent oxidoreductase [Nocardiopsis endophytica]